MLPRTEGFPLVFIFPGTALRGGGGEGGGAKHVTLVDCPPPPTLPRKRQGCPGKIQA